MPQKKLARAPQKQRLLNFNKRIKMDKITFSEEEAYFPVTMSQFEDLVNEMLNSINKLCDPHFVSSDYMAQVTMAVIHALDRKEGILKKSEIFERCVHAVSCHVTHHVVQEIQEKLKAQAAKEKAESSIPTLSVVSDQNIEQ